LPCGPLRKLAGAKRPHRQGSGGCAVLDAELGKYLFQMFIHGPRTQGENVRDVTFLVVVFSGAQSLLGTIFSALAISQSQSTLEFFLTGSMAKVLTLLAVIGAPLPSFGFAKGSN
jgi:urea transport system permease protein